MKITRTRGIEWTQAIDHGRFGQRRKALGGGSKLDCGLWELLPGKRSFPLHAHHVTDEAMYVISGRAKVRTPDGETEIGAGDFVAFAAGGPAHQLINDGSEPMVYVAMSAMTGSDIVEYPDSGKLACVAGAGPERKRFIFRKKDEVQNYFDGED
jgi:uncharacterized cupin superfamily protein